MNNHKVREIIKLYKLHFSTIHNEEIYKWRAVKCFQDNWNIDAPDFLTMLDKSFASTKNLLDSGKYFPKRMLHEYVTREPETVRQLFKELYNENTDLIERIEIFRENIVLLHERHLNIKNNYQDHRAILVYLCLYYPDIYYLFKFSMFKDFIILIDYPFKPKRNDVQNILEYLTLCEIIRAEIIKDTELLELHKTRINKNEFSDSSYHILTQDIIYAAVKHIDIFKLVEKQAPAFDRLIKVNTPDPDIAMSEKVNLKGSFTNYIANEKEKKRIGDLGELLVMQYEQEKLASLGVNKVPKHIAKSKGDGLGFDILSYNEKGEEILIEVKTTSFNLSTPFYITRNELIRSVQDSNKFYLYRLFDFDDNNNTAKYYVQQGNLTELCTNPILYRVVVRK